MAEHLSQSELDYPFKLLEYFNGFRVSKVTCSTSYFSSFDKHVRFRRELSVVIYLGFIIDQLLSPVNPCWSINVPSCINPMIGSYKIHIFTSCNQCSFGIFALINYLNLGTVIKIVAD